jgi:glyoxylase-like metal-dependent hydrolase (beta-lactamase superfamily II)
MKTSPTSVVLFFVPVALSGLTADDEARGRAILDAALTALGGAARLEAVESWDVEGNGRENLTAEIQGLSPDEPTWREHEERLGVDTRSLSVAWHRRTPRNDGSVRWRRMIRTPESSGFVDFVAGFGTLRPSPVPEPERRGLARRIPHFLILEAATRATRVVWEREIEIAGIPHDVVAVDFPDGETLRLAFARAPALLKRVSFRRPMPTLGEVTASWEWPEWKEDPAIAFAPSGHRILVGETLFQDVAYSSYRADSPEVRSLLEVPEEMKHPPASPARPSPSSLPATGEVAPGVHIAEVSGFTVMFVEFRDFVVAFDAPEAFVGLEAIPGSRPSSSVATEYRSLIESTLPKKPLRYVVVSHHHGDHLGGIRELARTGATVIVAPAHRSAAATALGAEGTVETVADRRTLSDGSRSLEIRNAGRNPHSDANLFLWLPAERILFQGDLFYYSEGDAFPPSGRETMNRFFAELLRGTRIEPAAIYGVHNYGAAPRERLLDSLR